MTTPKLPLHVADVADSPDWQVHDNDCEFIATCATLEDANFLVRLVNSHAALVEACKAAADLDEGFEDKARAALAQAGGGE
jgi:hypothetical protein